MNKSFATYTPRSKPMSYDAIAGREGCEPDTGNEWYGLKAFNEFCVHPHDKESEIFNQPPTVSYSIGPEIKGDPTKPFATSWAAWVGSIGVRVGKSDHIDPPADDVGENSSLYLHTKPAELTHSWNVNGDLAIAIQKDESTIELKQYIDDAGTVSTYSWRGKSPALYYSGHVVKGDPSNLGQLVCYYLHLFPETPRVLYARFESEGWATERIVMPSMRVGLDRLINVETVDINVKYVEDGIEKRITVYDAAVRLYAIDENGRDVELTTPEHFPLFTDRANIAIAPADGGVITVVTVDRELLPDKATIDIRTNGGQMIKPLIDTGLSPPSEKVSLSVEILGGDLL